MILAFVIVLFAGLCFMFYCLYRNQELMIKSMRENHEIFENRLRQLEALITFCAKAGRLHSSRAEVKEEIESTSCEKSFLQEEVPLQIKRSQSDSFLETSSQSSLASSINKDQSESLLNLEILNDSKKEASSFKEGLHFEEDPIAAAAAAGRILRTDDSTPQTPSRSRGLLKDISLDFDSKTSSRSASKENGMPELKL